MIAQHTNRMWTIYQIWVVHRIATVWSARISTPRLIDEYVDAKRRMSTMWLCESNNNNNKNGYSQLWFGWPGGMCGPIDRPFRIFFSESDTIDCRFKLSIFHDLKKTPISLESPSPKCGVYLLIASSWLIPDIYYVVYIWTNFEIAINNVNERLNSFKCARFTWNSRIHKHA